MGTKCSWWEAPCCSVNRLTNLDDDSACRRPREIHSQRSTSDLEAKICSPLYDVTFVLHPPVPQHFPQNGCLSLYPGRAVTVARPQNPPARKRSKFRHSSYLLSR